MVESGNPSKTTKEKTENKLEMMSPKMQRVEIDIGDKRQIQGGVQRKKVVARRIGSMPRSPGYKWSDRGILGAKEKTENKLEIISPKMQRIKKDIGDKRQIQGGVQRKKSRSPSRRISLMPRSPG